MSPTERERFEASKREAMSPAGLERLKASLQKLAQPITLADLLRDQKERSVVPKHVRPLLENLQPLLEYARTHPANAFQPFTESFLTDIASAAHGERIRRVLETPAARLIWLYEFAYSEPRSKDVEEELMVFVDPVVSMAGPFYSLAANRPAEEVWIDEGLVQKLRLTVKEMWERIRSVGKFIFTFPEPVIDGLVTIENQGNVRVLAAGGPSIEALFWANVVKLFADVGSFRFCQRDACGKPYVPTRAWSTSCSGSCASRERQARYRTKHGDKVSDQRHERYRHKLRKKLPNAKPARRRRGKNSKGETK
jgi:hypothetical protein